MRSTIEKRGSLIVIEGVDGTGKGTQAEMLGEYFRRNKISYVYLDFPDYETFYGRMVAQFLRGDFGEIDQVSPYLCALLYALNRKEKRKLIEDSLSAGRIVLANRYIGSNVAHQSGKFESTEERKRFISWLKKLEYGHNRMPREDLVIYLSLPQSVSSELTLKKKPRKYLNGSKLDIHEKSLDHIKITKDIYERLARSEKHWIRLNCSFNGKISSREDIHGKVVKILKSKNII